MITNISQENYSNMQPDTAQKMESDYLYLGESQVPGAGKGLFTSIKISKDEVIALFRGEHLTEEEVQQRLEMGEDRYFIELLDGTTFDCHRVHGLAKYANDAKGFIKSSFKNNSLITFDEWDNVCIVAKRDIKAGEEIFCSYGASYWKDYKKSL